MRDYLRTVELVEALARMVNRVIQHGKAEAQSALGSIEEIRTTLAAVANIDDFFDDLGPLWRCDEPSNERLDLYCRVSICQMRENGPESPPDGHGRAPRADLQYLRASTDRQGVSELGLEAQREAIDRHIRAARRKAAVGAH